MASAGIARRSFLGGVAGVLGAVALNPATPQVAAAAVASTETTATTAGALPAALHIIKALGESTAAFELYVADKERNDGYIMGELRRFYPEREADIKRLILEMPALETYSRCHLAYSYVQSTENVDYDWCKQVIERHGDQMECVLRLKVAEHDPEWARERLLRTNCPHRFTSALSSPINPNGGFGYTGITDDAIALVKELADKSPKELNDLERIDLHEAIMYITNDDDGPTAGVWGSKRHKAVLPIIRKYAMFDTLAVILDVSRDSYRRQHKQKLTPEIQMSLVKDFIGVATPIFDACKSEAARADGIAALNNELDMRTLHKTVFPVLMAFVRRCVERYPTWRMISTVADHNSRMIGNGYRTSGRLYDSNWIIQQILKGQWQGSKVGPYRVFVQPEEQAAALKVLKKVDVKKLTAEDRAQWTRLIFSCTCDANERRNIIKKAMA